jgi:carbon storage regulator
MALVLSRRIGETLCIGDNVRVTIMGTSGGQVRLSIEAPKEISVDRAEIRAKKDREKA